MAVKKKGYTPSDLRIIAQNGLTFKAGKVYLGADKNVFGVIYKSPLFFNSVFESNDGWIFMHGPKDLRPVTFKGTIYGSVGDGNYVNIGTFKQSQKKSYFSLLRREWLAKILVEDDEPVIKFFVKMHGTF